MKLPTKKITGFLQRKPVKTIVILLLFILSSLVLYSRFIGVKGEAGSPEKTITDLAGISRSDFRLNEQANLNLRVYAENTQTNVSDIILTLDASGDMAGDDLLAAKTAINGFIDRIDTSKQTKVGFVSYAGTAALVAQLTPIDSSSAKNGLRAQVNAVATGTNTCLGCAVQTANAELVSSRGRANGSKYIVLFSGSEEGPSPTVSNFLNGTVFTSAKANDPATAVEPNSQLNASISRNIRYFTVNFGSSATACSGTGGANYSMGCSLLRFAASKTNKANLTSGFNWASDYKSQFLGSSNAVDGAYHFNAASSDQLNSTYLAVLSAIEGVPAGLVAVEKLASQASYLETNYVKDKGGRIYPYVLANNTQDGSTFLTYDVTGVPESYYCDSSEPDCIANAKQSGVGQYYIENNYLNINLKVGLRAYGKFDLDSNYSGCETDNIQKVADNSKIDYFSSANFDPINNGTKYKSFSFSSLCVNVTSGGTGPKILKTVEDDSGNKKATFEAGDLVKVKLEIDESEGSRSDYIIEDFVPASANGAISYKFSRQNDGFAKEGIGATASGSKVRFVGTSELKLMHGKNFIEYSYRI